MSDETRGKVAKALRSFAREIHGDGESEEDRQAPILPEEGRYLTEADELLDLLDEGKEVKKVTVEQCINCGATIRDETRENVARLLKVNGEAASVEAHPLSGNPEYQHFVAQAGPYREGTGVVILGPVEISYLLTLLDDRDRGKTYPCEMTEQAMRDHEAMERALHEIVVNYPPGSMAYLTAQRGLGFTANAILAEKGESDD